jgi:hypothetical protein
VPSVNLPQHPDEHCPERPVLLAVDQQLAEGPNLRVTSEGANPLGPVEVRQHQDVEQFGAGSRTEGVQSLAKPALELVRSQWEATPSTVPRGQHRDRREGDSSAEVLASYMRRMVET